MKMKKQYLIFYTILSTIFLYYNTIVGATKEPKTKPLGKTSFIIEPKKTEEPATPTTTPPTAYDDTVSTAANTPVTVSPIANDIIDNSCIPAKIIAYTQPTHGNVSINPGGQAMTYTPHSNYSGVDRFGYTIEDNCNAKASANIIVTVAPPAPQPPVITNPNIIVSTTETTPPSPVNIINASNINSYISKSTSTGCTAMPITLTVPQLPENGQVIASGSTLTYTPNPGFVGNDVIQYTATQGSCGSANGMVTVTINPGQQKQQVQQQQQMQQQPFGEAQQQQMQQPPFGGAQQQPFGGAQQQPMQPPTPTPTPPAPAPMPPMPILPPPLPLKVPALPPAAPTPPAPQAPILPPPMPLAPPAPFIAPAPMLPPPLPAPMAPPMLPPMGPVGPQAPELPSLPGAELPEVPPAPEEDVYKIKPLKPIEKPLKKIMSMADQAKTKQEKEFIEKTIEAIETPKFETAPQFDAVLNKVKQDPQEKQVYLGQYLDPWKNMDPEAKIEMNFDNKELSELLKFLEDNLNITFILDDYIDPQRADGLKPIAGTKISFKSHVPLTLKEVWDLGLTFLEMSGFSIEPTTLPRTYHVTDSKAVANKDPLPTFIGTDPDLLPNNDSKIRYVYFIENADIETISKVIDTMRSASSGNLIKFPELKAVIMTDKSANIKSLMKIVQEIDQVTLPETLAIIRLKHADATRIRELYTELIGKDTRNIAFPFRQRKSPTTQYFSETTRVFDEPRTNSLIVLGTRDNIKKFEEFIFRYIDKKSDVPFSPLHIHQLKYIDADSTAKLLSDVITQFNSDPSRSTAATVGGVRDGNKFFKPTVKITSEPSGNRLVVNADYEDYLKIQEILEKLDVEQPQVAIKVLVLDVNLSDLTSLGTQLRNRRECCTEPGQNPGGKINFQTSGVGGLITRETVNGVVVNGAERLLGNLINLAALPASGPPGLFPAGTTLVTLGKDIFGFWGLLQMLQSYGRVSVIANPFLVTSHKYKAEITIGETRRVLSAIVTGQSTQQSFNDLSANLSVVITPQISFDDMIKLNIYVDISSFVEGGEPEFPSIIRKQISTEALAQNKEVIALGGLIRDRIIDSETKVPILGDIPLIGWLFKNKTKTVERTSLLILISPEIIKPHESATIEEFTNYQVDDAKETLYSMEYPSERRDPIHRWLFKDSKEEEVRSIDEFNSRQSRYVDESQKSKFAPVLDLNQSAAPKGKKGGRSDLTTKIAMRPTSKSILDFVSPKGNQKGVTT